MTDRRLLVATNHLRRAAASLTDLAREIRKHADWLHTVGEFEASSRMHVLGRELERHAAESEYLRRYLANADVDDATVPRFDPSKDPDA